jgi:hypothetical protein
LAERKLFHPLPFAFFEQYFFAGHTLHNSVFIILEANFFNIHHPISFD